MDCPRCGQPLVKSFYQGKISFQCPRGHGQTLTLPAVRALCGHPAFANALWRKALEAPEGQGGACPQCGRPMSLIRMSAHEHGVELDICCRCQVLWFDPHELEAVPLPAPSRADELPPKARELLALHAIEQTEVTPPTPGNAWSLLAGLLGFPVEINAPELMSRPWCTWSVAVLCVLVYLLSWGRLPEVIQEWGMIPSDCLRHSGLTFITSMFLHGGFWHLLGNLYFLLIFGDNVEDVLGKGTYLTVILGAGISATLLHIGFTPLSWVPCVGASGFISGIIAAYAVLFPKVTLSLLFRFGYCFRWVNVPAWGAFGLWLAYQVVMSIWFSQGGGVAYCAHLGGAVFGLAAGLLLRRGIRIF